MARVFIDGQAGTTGLQLAARLKAHGGVSVTTIDPALRKDVRARAEAMREADVVFLCLPDDAAREAAELVTGAHTVVIDTSTAHRVNPAWAYGFAELSPGHQGAIARAKRIANPGCHATGFIAAAYPLVKLGIAAPDYPFTCYSLTGYSGGGKQMIAQYEAADRPAALESPRGYALSQAHKHLPEMQKIVGLSDPPVFSPIVCDFYSGMAVSVPLVGRRLQRRCAPEDLVGALSEFYADCPLIEVLPAPEDGFIPANQLAGTDLIRLYVLGNDERMTVVCVLDNLGKGAAGAAIENMNLALGLPPLTSLRLSCPGA
ncbi:MAG: N-acetyl-gamma-glutamyl-phosphate reductase [Clostridia bacterium]